MDLGIVALIIGISLIVFFLIVGFIFRSFKLSTTNPIPGFLAEYEPISFWGPNIQGTDPTRNTCKVYDFSGSMVTFDGNLTAFPAQPTLNSDILNSVTPQTPGTCYDLDQIVAAQVYHVCTMTSNLEAGNFGTFNAEGQEGISFCIENDGTRASLGVQETYYTQYSSLFTADGNPTGSISCTVPACEGVLSLLAFNYQPGGPDQIYDLALCMSIEDTTTFIGKKCDISDRTQLVRMSRIYPSANTNSTGSGQQPITTGGKSGSITNIYDRDTGTCVIVNPDDPTSLILDSDCNRNWALVPSQLTNDQHSPQQIVWIKGLTADQIAQFNASLSSEKLLTLIQDNNLTSIQLVSTNVGSGFVVAPFAVFPNLNPPADSRASFQYVTYPLFNQILFTTVPSAF